MRPLPSRIALRAARRPRPSPWVLGGAITEATLDALLTALEARRDRGTLARRTDGAWVTRPTLALLRKPRPKTRRERSSARRRSATS